MPTDRHARLSNTERLDPGRVDGNTTDASRKLLPKSEKPYCVRLATDTGVHIVQDGVTTSVSIDCVTKVPTATRVAQSSATAGGDSKLKATIT